MFCIDILFFYLKEIEAFYWSYVGFTIVTLVGIYLSVRSNFYQFKVLAHPLQTIRALFQYTSPLWEEWLGSAILLLLFRLLWWAVPELFFGCGLQLSLELLLNMLKFTLA